MSRCALGEGAECDPARARLREAGDDALERPGAAEVQAVKVGSIDLAEIGRYIPAVESVTPAQVEQFAKERLAGPSSIIVVGDAKKFLDALKKEFPNVEVMPAATVK